LTIEGYGIKNIAKCQIILGLQGSFKQSQATSIISVDQQRERFFFLTLFLPVLCRFVRKALEGKGTNTRIPVQKERISFSLWHKRQNQQRLMLHKDTNKPRSEMGGVFLPTLDETDFHTGYRFTSGNS